MTMLTSGLLKNVLLLSILVIGPIHCGNFFKSPPTANNQQSECCSKLDLLSSTCEEVELDPDVLNTDDSVTLNSALFLDSTLDFKTKIEHLDMTGHTFINDDFYLHTVTNDKDGLTMGSIMDLTFGDQYVLSKCASGNYAIQTYLFKDLMEKILSK
eukprot:TRINITY_DN5363_c0_g1_i10.p1 TRINITY_DN5363_c0_g1~~TRINITY_DN5363_c0_g1_i10.p1  ORF type:complete len:156 (+),score=28.07 TRINITY_DN5363_c0_g1_i10:2-469(+)